MTLATPLFRKKFWGARTQKVLNLVVVERRCCL